MQMCGILLGVSSSNAHEAAAYKMTVDQLNAWGIVNNYNIQANSYFASYPYLHPHRQSIRTNRPVNPFR